ncbi:hypothetical protein ES708_04146 [subsurface metagenome]
MNVDVIENAQACAVISSLIQVSIRIQAMDGEKILVVIFEPEIEPVKRFVYVEPGKFRIEAGMPRFTKQHTGDVLVHKALVVIFGIENEHIPTIYERIGIEFDPERFFRVLA